MRSRWAADENVVNLPWGACPFLLKFFVSTSFFHGLNLPFQESGTRWSAELEQQLCYEVKTFLLAGHETSAAMLCWSVFELSQSQEYMNKVGIAGEGPS